MKKILKLIHRVFIWTPLLLLMLASLYLKEYALTQTKNPQLSVDYAQYRLQDNYALLEIYYSVSRQSLQFESEADGFSAQSLIKTYLEFNETSILIDSLNILDYVKSLDEISPSQNIAEMSILQIKHGNYLLKVEIRDLMTTMTEIFYDSLKLRDLSTPELVMSDIEFAISINAQKDRICKFDKNGLRVVPNANRTYGNGLPNLFFYAEAYHFKVEEEAINSTYHLDYYISDVDGKIVKEISGSPRGKPGSTSVIHGCLNISDLPAGIYALRIKLTDDFNGAIQKSEKGFFVYRPSETANQEVPESEVEQYSLEDEFLNMSEYEVDEYFEQVQYIATNQEKKFFKKLDLEGKRNFLIDFWKNRDPDPQTTVNERKVEYHQMLDYANQFFSQGKRAGWRSDQGRVLLVYGKPSQVDRFASSTNLKAHQVWYYYELDGGVEFVFVDVRLTGGFMLVHSTKRDEIRDDQWMENWAQKR